MNAMERARDLGQRIPKLQKLLAAKNKLDIYTAYKKVLSDVAGVLNIYAIIAGELRIRNAEVAGFKGSAIGMQKETRRIAEKFGDDANVIIAPETAYTFWEPLKRMPDKVKKELEISWTKYVETRIPPGQAEILEVLSRVRGLAAQVDAVSRRRADMHNLGRSLPSEEAFNRLDELALQVQQAWEDLDCEDLPVVVLTFLKKAHQNGISLADMGNEVFDWLRERNLLGTYVVRGR
jgi:hypothetical protein